MIYCKTRIRTKPGIGKMLGGMNTVAGYILAQSIEERRKCLLKLRICWLNSNFGRFVGLGFVQSVISEYGMASTTCLFETVLVD